MINATLDLRLNANTLQHIFLFCLLLPIKACRNLTAGDFFHVQDNKDILEKIQSHNQK